MLSREELNLRYLDNKQKKALFAPLPSNFFIDNILPFYGGAKLLKEEKEKRKKEETTKEAMRIMYINEELGLLGVPQLRKLATFINLEGRSKLKTRDDLEEALADKFPDYKELKKAIGAAGL
jgi:hypothetical protein